MQVHISLFHKLMGWNISQVFQIFVIYQIIADGLKKEC